jgi:hypothetical protein
MTQEEITAESGLGDVLEGYKAVKFFPLRGLTSAATFRSEEITPLNWGSEETKEKIAASMKKSKWLKKRLTGEKGFKIATMQAVELAVEKAKAYEVQRQKLREGEDVELSEDEDLDEAQQGCEDGDSDEVEDENASGIGARRKGQKQQRKLAEEHLLVGDTIG